MGSIELTSICMCMPLYVCMHACKVHAPVGTHTSTYKEENEMSHRYEAECALLRESKSLDAQFISLRTSGSGIKETILDYCGQAPVDVLVLGSKELSDTTKPIHLGSICAAIASETRTHLFLVKSFGVPT